MKHTKNERKAIRGDDLEKKGFFRTESGLITNGKQYVNGIVINDREGVYATEGIDWIGFPFVAEPKVNVGDMEPVDVYELPVKGIFSDAKLMNPVYEFGQDEVGCHVINETVALMWQGCKFVHKKTFRTENTAPWLKDRKEAWKRTQENIAQKIRP
jgi:hypothetical protein